MSNNSSTLNWKGIVIGTLFGLLIAWVLTIIVQTLMIVIDRTKRTDDVRVELDDVAGSPARVAVVGGK